MISIPFASLLMLIWFVMGIALACTLTVPFIIKFERMYVDLSKDILSRWNKYPPPKDIGKQYQCSGVYIIEYDGFYKIGCASNVASRLYNYSTSLPMKYGLVSVYKTSKPRELELIIHEAVAEKRYRNEWFRLTTDDIEFIDRYAVSRSAHVALYGED